MSNLAPELNIVRPRSVTEAVAARHEHEPSCYLAGGTDLVVNMRHGLSHPDMLIDLSAIDELAGIRVDAHAVRIGAGVTIAALARHPAFAAEYRAIREAAEAIAAPGHRAIGTVGGNLCLDTRCIYYNQSEWWRRANGYCLKRRGDVCHVAPQGEHCHAAFTGDLAPALMVLGAEAEVAGMRGRRRIPLSELYREDGRDHLALSAEDLLVAVHLPIDPGRTPWSGYSKVRVREAIDYPLAGVAAAIRISDGTVGVLRIALTGTNSRPFLVSGTEALSSRPVDDALLRDVDRLVQKQVQPMRTTVASAQYRRLAAAALACRLVQSLASRAGAK
jgi:4-hydroxybenzoyl-CoA reductase subunit beta